jgi:excisionase family DNA binding protein
MHHDQGYVSVGQAARYCGVSEKNIRRRVAEGRIPSYQPGGRGSAIRIPFDALTHVLVKVTGDPTALANRDRELPQVKPNHRLPGPKWR